MTTDTVMDKIAKLLQVAEGEANENESAVALQMAQRLADAHNLDIDTVGKSGAREDSKIRKGMYQFQRDLYRDVADINHCVCFIAARVGYGKPSIRLVGSKINVTTVKNLCEYVEGVANRLVKESYETRMFLSKKAHYFREGVVERMVERIRDKREEEERKREMRRREEQEQHPGSETAIVLMKDVSLAEERANYDYLHGEGAWEKQRERNRKWKEERIKAQEEYEQWKVDHPEEYQKQLERQKKEEEKWEKREKTNARNREKARQKRIDEFGYDPNDYRRRKLTKWDSNDYHAGRDEAETVSLNEQIDGNNGTTKKALREE